MVTKGQHEGSCGDGTGQYETEVVDTHTRM